MTVSKWGEFRFRKEDSARHSRFIEVVVYTQEGTNAGKLRE